MSGMLFKGMLPCRVKVDGVGQDKTCQRVNDTLWNQIFNPIFRLFTDPVVNGDTRLFRCSLEIKDSKPGTVVLC